MTSDYIKVTLTQRVKRGNTTHYGNHYMAVLPESVVRAHFNIKKSIRFRRYNIYVKRTDTYLRIMNELWELFLKDIDKSPKGRV